MNDHLKAKTMSSCLLFLAAIALLCLAPLTAHAATSSVTIQTDKSAYTAGTGTILVSGTVAPAPGISGTFVAISITSPNGTIADANQFVVNPSTGAYNGTFVTGGPTYGTQGTYTISANYNNAVASAQFQYGNVTTTSQSAAGSTTTTVGVTTTVTSAVQTTVTQNQATTTTLSQQEQTTVSSTALTTITSTQSSSDTTALAVGAVAVIIAILAAVMAVTAMRRK